MSDHEDHPLFHIPVLPPSNMQAEQRLLSALLTCTLPCELASHLKPEHFADPLHGKIFAKAMDAVTLAGSVNPLAVHHHFNRTRELEEMGGTAYLTQLADMDEVTVSQATAAVRTIRDAWARRCLIDLGDGLKRTALYTTEHAFEPPEHHGPKEQVQALVIALRAHLKGAEALLADLGT